MTAAVSELPLSWQQETVQFMVPAVDLPWCCSQSEGESGGAGVSAGGTAEWLWAGQRPAAQQGMCCAFQAAAQSGTHKSKAARRHTIAPSFLPGAKGVWSNCRIDASLDSSMTGRTDRLRSSKVWRRVDK